MATTSPDALLDAPQSAIIAQGISRQFGQLKAVDALSLEVFSGEIYGFLGPNGAGKTTAVRMLCTLLSATSGTAHVAGFDVEKNPHEVRKRIGVALQNTALDEKMSGRDLLKIQGRYYGMTHSDTAQRIKELEPILEMDAIDRKVGTYSGGMKRRLDLAIALIHRPQVLFLDEPTTGLDPSSRTKVWEEIQRLNAQMNVTIFLTTQYLEEADELANRVGIINSGRLVANDTPQELKRQVGKDIIVVNLTSSQEAETTKESSDTSPDSASSDNTNPDNSPTNFATATSTATQKAEEILAKVPGVENVDVRGSELAISTSQGAATISPVALALSEAGVFVEKVSLYTPTLDDVFFKLTGERIEVTEESAPDS